MYYFRLTSSFYNNFKSRATNITPDSTAITYKQSQSRLKDALIVEIACNSITSSPSLDSQHTPRTHIPRARACTHKSSSLSPRQPIAPMIARYMHTSSSFLLLAHNAYSLVLSARQAVVTISTSLTAYTHSYICKRRSASLSLCLETPRGASSRSKDRFNPRAAATANKQGPIGVCLPSVIRADK